MTLYPDSGKVGGSWHATIDATGRNSFNGDCMGYCVADFTATASAFWQMVIDEASDHVGEIEPCPHPVGECEFHDEQDAVNGFRSIASAFG